MLRAPSAQYEYAREVGIFFELIISYLKVKGHETPIKTIMRTIILLILRVINNKNLSSLVFISKRLSLNFSREIFNQDILRVHPKDNMFKYLSL